MAANKKNLVVKIDEELHKKMKLHIVAQGITIQEYIETLIKKDIEKEK